MTKAFTTTGEKSGIRSQDASASQNTSKAGSRFIDHRPETLLQRKLHQMANKDAGHMLPVQQKSALEEDELLQGKFNTTQRQELEEEELQMKVLPLQKKTGPESGRTENNTGLPDNLKSGIESLSGYAMDDVKVHYNSNQPAQINAHAYAQGTDIHLGTGQEKHLPHEAWHVVQQKQGRVKPTLQMKGRVSINDDIRLEKEADAMGSRALNFVNNASHFVSNHKEIGINGPINQVRKSSESNASAPLQCLTLNATNWDNVDSIKASSAGAGGVLFVDDGNGPLVVKPNVEAEDEKIAAYLHSAIAGRIRENKGLRSIDGWQIKGLKIRIADANDVQGIQAASARINAGLQGNVEQQARTTDLLGKIAAGTTMIQEAAAQPAESLAALMVKEADNHIKAPEDRRHGRSDKSKVKDTSPLKLLTKNPSFVEALGRLTAADIVAGNGDRLIVKPNLDNFIINLGDQTIFAIDNMEQGAPLAITNSAVSLLQWASYPAQAAFIKKDFDRLAFEAWSPLMDKTFQGKSVTQELIEGVTNDDAARPFVGTEQQQALVADKLESHLKAIMKSFAKGLKDGHDLILRKGRIEGDDPTSNNFNSRISVIEKGGV